MNPQGKLELTIWRINWWWLASTMDEFCLASGMTRDAASCWAKYLRNNGVEMKVMPSAKGRHSDENFTPDDWAHLKLVVIGVKTLIAQREQAKADAADADRQRQKVSAASAWSSVSGADE